MGETLRRIQSERGHSPPEHSPDDSRARHASGTGQTAEAVLGALRLDTKNLSKHAHLRVEGYKACAHEWFS